MGTNSLQAAASKRRSFNLPSFRRSSAAEGMAGSLVEEAARIQKAAAWQWYTRGVGREAAVLAPTRPAVRNSQAPASDDKSCMGASGPISKGGKAILCNSNMPQKKIVELPLAESQRGASRFKAEAGSLSSTRPAASGVVRPAPPAPSGGPSTTPLYDEFELSSLRTHMADFVQGLEHQHTSDNEQCSPAAGVHGRSRPPPPSVSIDHNQTKAPPAVAVASSDKDHQPTMLPSSPAPVASTIPFHMRPFSALQKIFRKVQLFGSVPKCTKNSSQPMDSAPAVLEPAQVLYNDVRSTTQYHHHHYIHHHHHHHHFSRSPEEQASIILSRRRHSESASSRPCSPSLMEADSDGEEDEDEAEESRIAAYLARRRRRHSDIFSRYGLRPENVAGFGKDEGMKEESAKVESPMEFSRPYNSERFLPRKVATMVGKDNIAQPVEDEFDEGTFAGIRSRRRHSAELTHREEPSLERTGGKSKSGAYTLGGAGAGGGMPASMRRDRRRYSESSKVRPEAGAKRTPSPGSRSYWISPSARYFNFADVQECHIGVPMNAATEGF